MAIAGNVINSSKVLVIGDYAWSETSPQQITSSIVEVFRSKDTPAIVIEEIKTALHISLIFVGTDIYLGLLYQEPIYVGSIPEGWHLTYGWITYYGEDGYEAMIYGDRGNFNLPFYATFDDTFNEEDFNLDEQNPTLEETPTLNIVQLVDNRSYYARHKGMFSTDPITVSHYNGEMVFDNVNEHGRVISYGNAPTHSSGIDYYNYDYQYDYSRNARREEQQGNEIAYLTIVETRYYKVVQQASSNAVARDGRNKTYARPRQGFSNGFRTFEGHPPPGSDRNEQSNYPARCDPSNRGNANFSASISQTRERRENYEEFYSNVYYLYLLNQKIYGTQTERKTRTMERSAGWTDEIAGTHSCEDFPSYYGYTSYRWDTPAGGFTVQVQPLSRSFSLSYSFERNRSIEIPVSLTQGVEDSDRLSINYSQNISETHPGVTFFNSGTITGDVYSLDGATASGEFSHTSTTEYEKISSSQRVRLEGYVSTDLAIYEAWSYYSRKTYTEITTAIGSDFPLASTDGYYSGASEYIPGIPYYNTVGAINTSNGTGSPGPYLGSVGWGTSGKAYFQTERTTTTTYDLNNDQRKHYYARDSNLVEIDREPFDVFSLYHYNDNAPVNPLHDRLKNEILPIEIDMGDGYLYTGASRVLVRTEKVERENREWNFAVGEYAFFGADQRIGTSYYGNDPDLSGNELDEVLNYTEDFENYPGHILDSPVGTGVYAVCFFWVEGKKVYKRFEGVISEAELVVPEDDRAYYTNIKIRLDSVEYFGFSAIAEEDIIYSSRQWLHIFPKDNCFEMFIRENFQYNPTNCHLHERDGKTYILCSPNYQIIPPEIAELVIEKQQNPNADIDFPNTLNLYENVDVEIFELKGGKLIHQGSKPAPAYPISPEWLGSIIAHYSVSGYYYTNTESRSGYPLEWWEEDREKEAF